MSIQERAPLDHSLPLSDEAFASVLDAAKSGAEWAWEHIYYEYYGPVRGYLASRGANDSEELTGDVLLRVARKIHSFEGHESSFRSWVFVIAHRLLIDARRRSGRRPELVLLSDETHGGDVEVEAIDQLVTAEIHEYFSLLSDRQKDVLSLRVIAGLSLQETAQVLGMKVGAVKTMQHRAIKALKAEVDRGGVTL